MLHGCQDRDMLAGVPAHHICSVNRKQLRSNVDGLRPTVRLPTQAGAATLVLRTYATLGILLFATDVALRYKEPSR